MQIIKKNAIQCRHCGDIIESHSVHDFKSCSCQTCSVDGGHNYIRRSFKTSPEADFIELSKYNGTGDSPVAYDKESFREFLNRLQPGF